MAELRITAVRTIVTQPVGSRHVIVRVETSWRRNLKVSLTFSNRRQEEISIRSARSSRQAARTIRPASRVCMAPIGASSPTSAASNAAKAAGSSSPTTSSLNDRSQPPTTYVLQTSTSLPFYTSI